MINHMMQNMMKRSLFALAFCSVLPVVGCQGTLDYFVVTNGDDEIVLSPLLQANGEHCSPRGYSLASPRQLAQIAAEHGATGIIESRYRGRLPTDPAVVAEYEELQKKFDGDVQLIVSQPGAKDAVAALDFYYSWKGFKPAVMAGNDFWTNYRFYLDGDDGRFLEIPEAAYQSADYLAAVLCVKTAPFAC